MVASISYLPGLAHYPCDGEREGKHKLCEAVHRLPRGDLLSPYNARAASLAGSIPACCQVVWRGSGSALQQWPGKGGFL